MHDNPNPAPVSQVETQPCRSGKAASLGTKPKLTFPGDLVSESMPVNRASFESFLMTFPFGCVGQEGSTTSLAQVAQRGPPEKRGHLL